MVFKAVAILGLDIFTCVTMISTDHVSTHFQAWTLPQVVHEWPRGLGAK